jgi:hypothetical protein
MRTAQDITYHINERRWISNAWPIADHMFNRDPECFNRYIDMQANAAREDGFPGIANDMLRYKR